MSDDEMGDEDLRQMLRLLDALRQVQHERDVAADAKDKRPTFESYWADYSGVMVDDDTDDTHVKESRNAFKAGVVCGFSAVFHGFDQLKKLTKGSVAYDLEDKRIQAWMMRRQREVQSYAKELSKAKLMREAGLSDVEAESVHVMSLSEVVDSLHDLFDTKEKKE